MDKTAPPEPFSPGDIFKEFTFLPPQESKYGAFAECDPGSQRDFCKKLEKQQPKPLDLDLEMAVRAEVCVSYWGGHIGTADQKFRVNGHEWIQIPQPFTTPSAPQCYYRTLLSADPVSIPLEFLKPGINNFQFTCGPQIKYAFDWGFYWVYSFTVRVYYSEDKPHVKGKIASPESGTGLGDNPTLLVKARGPAEQVDLVGLYEDFDWEGNGLFRKWHFQLEYGKLKRHIGSLKKQPYNVTWDTTWLPDQPEPMKILARITDKKGITYITPFGEDLVLKRQRSVSMFKPSNVPENFGSRVGNRKSCTIMVTDDPGKAKRARLVLSTWSADHAEDIGLNGKTLVPKIGVVHNYSYDAIPVPLEMIRKGKNEFHVFSTTEHHAAEINWPGPVLMLEY